MIEEQIKVEVVEEKNEFSLSIIPVSKNKTPFKTWTEFQTTKAPTKGWFSHYFNSGYVGIITGKVSGNLEVIDVDEKNDPDKTIIQELLKRIPNELLDRLIIQKTINKGIHLIYRCTEVEIEKNLKLAHHTDGNVIIETRGEGGYICTNKNTYQIVQGVFDLENLEIDIPDITKSERNFLLETARSLNRLVQSNNGSSNNNTPKNNHTGGYTYTEPAINDFNEKFNIIELFEKHGWSVVNKDNEKIFLKRPGDTSATHSGYYYLDTKVFVCFSSSTNFDTSKLYNHFQALKVLEKISDYRTALRKLQQLGYSISEKKDKLTVEDIAEYLNNQGVRYDTFIQDLTLNGRIIDELEYNTLYIDLKKYFDKEIPRTKFEEIIKSNYITTFNPIEEFVSANQHRQTTGTFEKWIDCIELENKNVKKENVLHFLKKWYVGMIAQAMNGEFPNEFFLTILSTEQGIGKTTFLRKYVLPKELYDYRVEHSLSFDEDFQVIMSQSLLVIDDEMDGRTYESAQTFKSILSKKDMTIRRKYDRRISRIKRRCSFAGSGNNLNVIRERNNRRILPIEVKSLHFHKLNQVDYSDLFMEAYYLYTSDFRYSYQFSDKSMLDNLYCDYVQKSDIEMLLDEQVISPESDQDKEFISSIEIVSKLTFHFNEFSRRINVITIGKILTEKGFRTIRKGQNKTSGYEISKSSPLLRLVR